MSDEAVFAVIFSARRQHNGARDDGYDEAARRMAALSREMPGFIDMEHARGADGFGITICYWDSEAAIANWRRNAEHQAAQQQGADEWYTDYKVTIARVIRSHAMGDRKKDRE